MAVPPVLLAPEFTVLWQRVATYLDRAGLDQRGRIRFPEVEPVVVARLGELLDRRLGTSSRMLDLRQLDERLAERHGVGLLDLLAAAGCTPTGRREAREASRARDVERDEALTAAAVSAFGDLPWVHAWVGDVRSRVPDADAARRVVVDVDRVLTDAAGARPRSRGEVAARVLGGAHRLDPDGDRRYLVGTALARRDQACGDDRGGRGREDPALWADAGLPGDLVSAPVLTWGLPLLGDGVAAATRTLTAAGAPMALSTLVLRDLTVRVPAGTVVLSVENPRLVEAAAQSRLGAPVITTSGNPTTAPLLLVAALLEAGAVVRHHGDMDPAGLAITARLADLGVVPWRMDAADHRAALRVADEDGITLRRTEAAITPTPWDPELAVALHEDRRVVEEERVMDGLLAEHAGTSGGAVTGAVRDT